MKASLILFAAATSIVSNLHAEWEYIFKDVYFDDFYFDFIEETEPSKVFAIDESGTLTISGEDNPEGYLQTLDEFENFELAFAFRFPDGNGKSGVIIHSSTDTAHSIWPEGIEIQLEPEKTGDFWLLNNEIEVEESQLPSKAAERNRRLRLPPPKVTYTTAHLVKEREHPPEEWNEMRILAEKDNVKVYLNDILINEGKNASVSAGYITIQAEESNLEIKDFRIRSL